MTRTDFTPLAPALSEPRRAGGRPRITGRTCAAAAVLALAAGAALAAAGVPGERGTPPADRKGVMTLDEGGLRYAYQLITGDEALYDLSADPRQLRNLAPVRRADAERMRRALAERFDVEDVDVLRSLRAEEFRRLRSCGYL